MGERFMRCTFDPRHIMPESSLRKHHITCFQKHRDTFRSCYWHAEHYIRKEEYEAHKKTCEMRFEGEKFLQGMDGCIKDGKKLTSAPLKDLNQNWAKWGKLSEIKRYLPPPVPLEETKTQIVEIYVGLEWARGMTNDQKREHARKGALNYIQMFS